MACPMRPESTSFKISATKRNQSIFKELLVAFDLLTLSILDRRNIFTNRLSCRFGKRFGGGAVTVMD
jgi:hypothetical protein